MILSNEISINWKSDKLACTVFAIYRAQFILNEVVGEAMSMGQLISVSFFGLKTLLNSAVAEETMVKAKISTKPVTFEIF